VGLNDIFGRFRQVLEVVDSPFAEVFESAAYANFATPAETRLEVNTLQINESTAVALVFVMPQFPQRNSLRRANCANASGRYSQQFKKGFSNHINLSPICRLWRSRKIGLGGQSTLER
jgi:hypothetical protein